MRSAVALAIAIACTACAEHRPAVTSSSGSPAAITPSDDGARQPASTAPGTSGAPAAPPGASRTTDAGSTGGAAMAGAAASTAGSSSATAGSGGAAPIDDPPPPVRATESVLPAPRGVCPELVSGTVTVMGMAVEVLAGTPGATPGPLLLAWHGTGVTGRDAIEMLPASVRSEIEATGGIVFAPNSDGDVREGTDTAVSLGIWFTGDFAVADELVACAYQHHGIDPRRIYTTGCAAGGLMAGAFTLARSSYVAAAVINSGGLVASDAFTLQDQMRVPSVISLYGLSELIPVSFEQTSRFLADAITVAGGFAVDCRLDSGLCAAPVEMQQRAWEFLKAHPFGVAPFPYANGLPHGFPESCRIWPGGGAPATQPICGGAHAPCSAYAPSDEPTFCTRHGCSWQAGACTGTPHLCADVADAECGVVTFDHRGCDPL